MISAFWLLQEIKNPVCISHDFLIRGEQAVIGVNHCSFFIEIAGAHKPIVCISIVSPFFDHTKLRMHFHVRDTCQDPCAFIFQPVLPVEVGLLIEPCT